MSDGLSWEALGVISVVAGFLIACLLKIHTRLGELVSAVAALGKRLAADQADHARLWGVVEKHEDRIDNLERQSRPEE